MNSKTCRHTRREIDELEPGRPLAEHTAAHLAACPACMQFQSERASLRELMAGLEPVAAPADFDMRLRARLARERSASEPQPFFSRLIGVPAIALAAVAVLAVATVVWIGQRDNSQPTQLATKTTPVTAPPNSGEAGTVKQGTTTQTASVTGANGERGNFPSNRKRPASRSPRSEDYGLASARNVTQNDSFLNSPSKPVVVSLEDDKGAKRKIALPPVSFGAQSLVDNRVPVSYTGNSRVW